MIVSRRMIEDEATGEVERVLLRAGRAAEPSREAEERLLALLAGATGSALVGGTAGYVAQKSWLAKLLSTPAAKIGALLLGGGTLAGGTYGTNRWLSADDGTELQAAATQPATPVSARGRAAPAEEPDEPQPPAPEPEPLGAHPVPARPEPSPAPPTGVHAPTRSEVSRGPARSIEPATPGTEAPSPPGEASVSHEGEGEGETNAEARPDTTRDTLLAEELRELDAARAALRVGDREGARLRLDAYFQRFSNGFLLPEARRLEQQAQSDNGRLP